MITDKLINIFTSYGLEANMAISASLIVLAVATLIISFSANYITKNILVKYLRLQLNRSGARHFQLLYKHSVFTKISHLAPFIIIYLSAPLFTIDGAAFTTTLTMAIKVAMRCYFVIVMCLVLTAILDYSDDLYNTLAIAKKRPIKSYLQVVKLFVYAFTILMLISIVLHKSPIVFLTGLGAMTAVLMLVFKDTIMGFVASIQLSTYDMVRIGDWIEIPGYGADGDVIDMSLNTIKIQNFDKTIVTVPTHSLLTSGVKNWRGMSDSGGRRIKRAIHIDVQSIRFCNQEDLEKLKKIQLLNQYISDKETEISEHNTNISANKEVLANGRNLTNLGLFRIYAEHYLSQHAKINKDMTFLIRQLAPSEIGIPIELYIFTKTTNWLEYEHDQADIFDHLLAIVPYFDLRVYQRM